MRGPPRVAWAHIGRGKSPERKKAGRDFLPAFEASAVRQRDWRQNEYGSSSTPLFVDSLGRIVMRMGCEYRSRSVPPVLELTTR